MKSNINIPSRKLQLNKIQTISRIFKEIQNISSTKFLALLVLSFCTTFFEGFGLISIIPICQFYLQNLGLEIGGITDSSISSLVTKTLESLGIGSSIHLEAVLVFYLFFLLLIALLSWARIRLAASLQASFMRRKRNSLFKRHILSSLENFLEFRGGQLVNALGTQLDEATTCIFIFLELTSAFVLIVIFLIFAIFNSPLLSTLALITCLSSWFILKSLVSRNSRLGLKIVEETSDYYSNINQLLTNYKRIRSTGAESEAIERGKYYSDSLAKLLMETARNHALLNLVSTMISGFVLAFLAYASIFWGAYSWVATTTSLLFLIRILGKFSSFQIKLQHFLQLAPAFIKTLMLEESLQESQLQITPAISGIKFESLEVNNIQFSWRGESKFTLSPPNFTLYPEEIVVLHGKSGSGKSTLADILAGLLEPDSGELILNGRKQVNPALRRNLISYVPQQITLLGSSIRDNLTFGLGQLCDESIQTCLEIVELNDRIADLDALPGENGLKLSGGEKQRLLISQALLLQRPILILDEATSGLDIDMERRIFQRIRDSFPQISILAISHKTSVKNLAHRVVEFKSV